MAYVKPRISYESIGLGFFWAWCYCLWFVPSIYPQFPTTSPGTDLSWLIVLGSAAVVQFAIPLYCRKRELPTNIALYIAVPLLNCLSTLGISVSRYFAGLGLIYIASSLLSGICSALLWHLWGSRFAYLKKPIAEAIAAGFGGVVLVSILICAILPAVVSNIYIAIMPILSGILLLLSREKEPQTAKRPLLPRKIRKTSRSAIVKICLIAFVVCTVCTYTWASVPPESLPSNQWMTMVGVGTGALFMIVASLPSRICGERMDAAHILNLIVLLAISAVLLSLSKNPEFAAAAYVSALSASVVIDVLLATYFVALVTKGYIASSTAFGYSEGFIRAAMLLGNVIANTLPSQIQNIAMGYDNATPYLIAVFLLAIALEQLGRQSNDIRKIMHAAPRPSDIEENCQAIAGEFSLSNREYEILVLLGQGYNTRSIANYMVLSPHTVQTHIKHIYYKVGTHSRSELFDYINLNRMPKNNELD